MEAYFESLIEQSGASDFVIVRDDAALTASPSRKNSCCEQRLSSSSESSLSSSAPCMGPPCLPRRKRSADDIISAISKGSKRSGQRAANSKVLKSFFDEVMGPAASKRKSEIKLIDEALKLRYPSRTSRTSRQTARWEAAPCSPPQASW